MPPELAAHAAQQGGVFTRRQAIAAGYTDKQVEHRLQRGRWIAVRRGVYAESTMYEQVGLHPRGRHRMAVAAALLRAKPGAAASHTSAARLYGVRFIGAWPVAPTITVPLDRDVKMRAKRTRLLDRRVAHLPEAHVCTLPGVRATIPARTLVEVSRELPFAEAVVVADDMLRRVLVARREIDKVVVFCARWPGIERAAKVAAFADGRAESPLESYGRAVLHLEGAPPLRPQAWLYDSRGVIGRVDLYADDYFTVVEFDGLVKYDDRDGDVLVDEKLRQERLEEAGFVVVRAMQRQLDQEPGRTADRVWSGCHRSLRRRADATPGEFTGFAGDAPAWYSRHLTPRVPPLWPLSGPD